MMSVTFLMAFDESGDLPLRVLGETMQKQRSRTAGLGAARELPDTQADRYQLRLDRLSVVQDLFVPEEPGGGFTLWYLPVLLPVPNRGSVTFSRRRIQVMDR
jgi:hypothetical protein